MADLDQDRLRDEIAAALLQIEGGKFNFKDEAALPTTLLTSIFQQCQDMVQSLDAARLAPVRCVHHFACTGGTLISRCIGAMPNVRLLSEVDPLSNIFESWKFTPTDLIRLGRSSSRPTENAVSIRLFLTGIDVLMKDALQVGVDMVLRDHPHSKFCVGQLDLERPSLRSIVARQYSHIGVVTLRHPLDSFLAISAHGTGWRSFEPFTLDEYARRYHAFLDEHDDLPMFRYEDFVLAPETEMQRICAALELGFDPGFQDTFPAIPLSGDSGRKSIQISERSRRQVPDEIEADRKTDGAYSSLCARLDYGNI